MLFYLLPTVLSLLFCTGFALFVGFKGLKRPANVGFGTLMIGLFIQESGVFLSVFTVAPLLFSTVSVFGDGLMAAGALLFALTFAREHETQIIKARWPLLLVFPLVLLPFVFLTLFELPAQTKALLPPLAVTPQGTLFFVLYLASLVYILMQVEQTFRNASGEVRYKIKYMILGVAAVLALEIYQAGQVLLFSHLNSRLFPVYSGALIVAHLLILFAVVRHRLLNVDIFVSRYVVYKSVTLVAVGIYLALVGVMVSGVQHFGGENIVHLIPIVVFAALLGMVILLLSEELRRKMQRFVSKNFYRNRHDYRETWQGFTDAVGGKTLLQELIPSLVEWLGETIGSNDAGIWLFDKDRMRYYLASRRGLSTAPSTWRDGAPMFEVLRAGGGAFQLKENHASFERIQSEDPAFFDKNPVTAWVPIFSGQEMTGIIVLGQKITGENYDVHDLELLSTVADQAASQIERVRLIEELAVVRELKAIHTLSSFFLHDLKNYTSTLSLLAQNVAKHGNNPDFQKDAFTTIEGTVDKMNQLIKHITVVAKGLVLARSEVDLNQLVEAAISGLKGALGLKGRIYSLFGDLPPLSADPEQLSNVFRNLIINACNASDEEGNVTIETRVAGQRIFFSVQDEGCGMAEQFIATKLFKPLRTTRAAGWGIGLFQCQQIVKAHGGRIVVESIEGQGSTFTVELPLSGK